MHEPDLAQLHADLDAARKARGLTWRSIAEETGVQPATLTRLGQGQGIDLRTFGALTRWLEIPPERFLHPDGDDRSDTDSLEAVLDYMSRVLRRTPAIPDDRRETIIRVVDFNVRAHLEAGR